MEAIRDTSDNGKNPAPGKYPYRRRQRPHCPVSCVNTAVASRRLELVNLKIRSLQYYISAISRLFLSKRECPPSINVFYLKNSVSQAIVFLFSKYSNGTFRKIVATSKCIGTTNCRG